RGGATPDAVPAMSKRPRATARIPVGRRRLDIAEHYSPQAPGQIPSRVRRGEGGSGRKAPFSGQRRGGAAGSRPPRAPRGGLGHGVAPHPPIVARPSPALG